MKTNAQLEDEIRKLRSRVRELEDTAVRLNRSIYELRKEVRGREIAEYLEHNEPKKQ